jgi:osmoprotectant transport system ATP-binding protein
VGDHPQISTPEGPAVIEFRAVDYRTADGKSIISNLNLSVAAGETFVLLGQSGSGKTTALKLINRLLQETSGTVQVDGRATRDWELTALRRRIGYVIQEGGLFPHFTVEKNVGLIPRLLGKSPDEVSRRVDEMLQLVDLDPSHFRTRYPHQLSGGQRQRVGVARALAGDPPILLMDEPFGALDPVVRAELQRQFKSLQGKLRKTIVLVTHDVPEALRLGTRIGLLESGALVGCYSRSEFVASTDPKIKQYRDAFIEHSLED